MIKQQQVLQIGSIDSFFNNQTSLFQYHINSPFILQFSGEFHIYYSNRYIIKHLSLGGNYIKFGDDKYINLTNVCMTKVINLKNGQIGIKLSKNGQSLEIYGELIIWIENIKKYVIQFEITSKYQFLKKLNESYSSIIYKAKNKQTLQEYVIKVFDKKRLLQNQFEAHNLFKQLKIFRQIQHSNIICFQEIFESNNHIYIIFDYLKGQKLIKLIDKKIILNENDVRLLIKPLFECVKYLHNNFIFHKHISLQNIILKERNEYNNPCLIDFSQSELLSNQEVEEQKIPQINIQKLSRFNTKIDILSLGIVMVSLLTGQHFLIDESIDDALMNKFKGQIDLQFIQPPLSDSCFDFLNLIFNQQSKIVTCNQLLDHPYFQIKQLKSERNIKIQHIGTTTNEIKQTFKITSLKQIQSKSPEQLKTISIQKKFNLISKSPSEKPNNYFLPPQTHLMFRRSSRQKRTLNFNMHNTIQEHSIDEY